MAAFETSLYGLAENLHVPTKDFSGTKLRKTSDIFQDISKLILAKSARTSPWLIVVDNVDETDEEESLLEMLYEVQGVFMIFTSRNQNALMSEASHIQLGELDTPDAIELVQTCLEMNVEYNRECIKDLCELLQNFPLALQQAVGYIKQQQLLSIKGSTYGIADYIDKFKSEAEKLLGFALPKFAHKYGKTTLLTWNVAIGKLKNDCGKVGQCAVELLHILAFVCPDGISFSLLRNLYRKSFDKNSTHIEEAVVLIKMYSLIKAEDFILQIHRILQKVIQISINSEEEGFANFFNQLLPGIQHVLEECRRNDFDSIVWNHAAQYDTFIIQFKYLPEMISNAKRLYGLYRETLPFCNTNYDNLRRVLGEDDIQTLKMKAELACCLSQIKPTEVALKIAEEVYERMKSILGEENKLTLETAHIVAGILNGLTRFDEALKVFRLILEAREKIFAPNDKIIILTKQEMANTLLNSGNFDEAIGIYEHVLEWQKVRFSVEYPLTLATMHSLGVCFRLQGRYPEAKGMLETTLELRLRVLGEEHWATLLTKSQLALTMSSLGENGKCLEMLKNVLNYQERLFGELHPHTLRTKENIKICTPTESGS